MAKVKTEYRLHYLTNNVCDKFTNKRSADKEFKRAAAVACVWITKDGRIIRSNTSLKEVTQ